MEPTPIGVDLNAKPLRVPPSFSRYCEKNEIFSLLEVGADTCCAVRELPQSCGVELSLSPFSTDTYESTPYRATG